MRADTFVTRRLEKERLQATLTQEDQAPENWTQLILMHPDGREIASLERNPVESGSLGSEELNEFADEIEGCAPVTAVKWLLEYFPRVRCVYAFEVLSGADHRNGWEILGAIKNRIWSFAPAILQADREGFSNEDGYHILWQFGDSVDGEWWMGVLEGGDWKHFRMDLGSHEHRAAFMEGRMPDGVEAAS